MGLGWVVLTLASLVAFYSAILPDPRLARLLRQPPNLTILTQSGEFIAERGMRRAYVSYKDIPPTLIDAVIVTEDRRFFTHFGFDPVGLARAFVANSRSGDVVQGGSTITQQLAKNLFLSSKRSFGRKFEEFILALWLETKFKKDEILELYLNRVYFGSGNYGIGAAAHHYFGKEPKDITPRRSSPACGADQSTVVLLTNGQSPAGAKPVHRDFAFSRPHRPHRHQSICRSFGQARPDESATLAPRFRSRADWVAEVAPMLVGDVDRNLIVETTIDTELQTTAVAAVESVMRVKGRTARANEAAVLILSPDGAVRAMVGGRNHAESQFNRAVRAMRQPGSSFKPFIYLAAIEAGYTPDTQIEDSQIEVGDWKPENYGKSYRGMITLRSALTHSSNMAAVRLTEAVGADRVVAAAHRLGVASVRNVGPTLALGTSEVTLLEMTSAFGVFANGGAAVLPEVIERIRDEQGTIVFERTTADRPRIVSARTVSAMNDMMNAVVAGGTGQNAQLPMYPAAGKTGTSQKHKDAWFVGYTAQWVGGVWIGNDNATPMRG